jgi:hypothetical protein
MRKGDRSAGSEVARSHQTAPATNNPQQSGQHDLPETRPAREGVLNFNMAVAESETWN